MFLEGVGDEEQFVFVLEPERPSVGHAFHEEMARVVEGRQAPAFRVRRARRSRCGSGAAELPKGALEDGTGTWPLMFGRP